MPLSLHENRGCRCFQTITTYLSQSRRPQPLWCWKPKLTKEIWKSAVYINKIQINRGSNKINPKVVAVFKFLSCWNRRETEQNSEVYTAYKMTKLKLNTCSETIFIMPVSEDGEEWWGFSEGNFQQVSMQECSNKFGCKEM